MHKNIFFPAFLLFVSLSACDNTQINNVKTIEYFDSHPTERTEQLNSCKESSPDESCKNAFRSYQKNAAKGKTILIN